MRDSNGVNRGAVRTEDRRARWDDLAVARWENEGGADGDKEPTDLRGTASRFGSGSTTSGLTANADGIRPGMDPVGR